MVSAPKEELPQAQESSQSSQVNTKEKNITRLHARQQELAMKSHRSTEKVTI